MDVNKKEKDRFLFLKKVYEVTNGNKSQPVRGEAIGQELGLSSEETTNIYYYLKDEYLIDGYGAGLSLLITHAGIVEVEEALKNPTKATEHFLPYNIIHIGTMTNSVIQQGSNGSTQNVTFNKELVPDLKNILEEIKAVMDKLTLSIEVQGELIAEVHTMEAQSLSPKPKMNIVRESLSSVRGILEGVVSEALAPSLISNITLLLSQMN